MDWDAKRIQRGENIRQHGFFNFALLVPMFAFGEIGIPTSALRNIGTQSVVNLTKVIY